MLDIGTKRFTRILVGEEPGLDNACHLYKIGRVEAVEGHPPGVTEFGFIKFQNGPIKETGVNGCHNEDLLAIVIDRLQNFQSGKLACDENEAALCFLKKALWWLNKRTEDRTKRAVEGTSQA